MEAAGSSEKLVSYRSIKTSTWTFTVVKIPILSFKITI
jgi:hypothetical protein